MAESNENRIVAALRQIMRAVDLHSRQLVRECGLTGPQLATLLEAVRHGPMTAGNLAKSISVSQSTLTGILDRLEARQLVQRARGPDRRSVTIMATDSGKALVGKAPSLLQESLRRSLSQLEEWEQSSILAALQRVAGMMGADQIDAAPMLDGGPMDGGPESFLSDRSSRTA
jgi:DNA-binding MarR family transcriptional regulator